MQGSSEVEILLDLPDKYLRSNEDQILRRVTD